tara:strand:- start:155848 stop:156681 length:834 start_codon:yes stop_codon:yes gene_type:complete
MSVTYGVFTITRQDIVDLSRAIAGCIPSSFMTDPRAPVRVAVQGSYESGKKIIADYGRNEIFGIEEAKLSFCDDKVHNNTCTAVFNKRAALSSCGHAEYDEYVYGQRDNETYEVSFINLAWMGGYSKAIPNRTNDTAKLAAHFKQRRYGGIAYIHNSVGFITQPDITINIESEGFTADAAGRAYHCCDVSSAIEDACDTDQHEISPEWCRFVQVTVHNEALDQQGKISDMLQAAFGCVDASRLPANVFTFFPDDNDILCDNGKFPLRKNHAHMLKCV